MNLKFTSNLRSGGIFITFRGVFRTLSNIYDGNFLAKVALKHLTIFSKNSMMDVLKNPRYASILKLPFLLGFLLLTLNISAILYLNLNL